MVAQKIGKPSSIRIKPLVSKKKKIKSGKRAHKDVHARKNGKPSTRIKSEVLQENKKDEKLAKLEYELWLKDSEKYISDGRVFEADREMVLSREEEEEKKRFEMILKQYNDISRRLLRNAFQQEQRELKEGKKLGYFEGSVADRIKVLKEGQRILDNTEIFASLRINKGE